MLGIVAGLLLNLLLLAGVVVAVVFITRAIRHGGRRGEPFQGAHWYMHLFVSGTDLLRQLLAAVGIALAMIGLVLLARPLGLGILGLRNSVLLGAAVGVAVAYRWRAPLVLAFSILGAYLWLGLWLANWAAPAAGTVAVLSGEALLAVTLWAVGRLHEGSDATRRFGFVYWLLGLAVLVVVLFWASSQMGLSALTDVSSKNAPPWHQLLGPWRVMLALGLLVAAALGTTAAAAIRRRISLAEAAGLAVVTVAFGLFYLVPPIPAATSAGGFFGGAAPKLTSAGVAWAVVFNALLLAGLLGLVAMGYARREDWLVNLGALLLFIFVLFKYFDWLFTFMDRSIAFIVAGLILLGAGLLMERGRRYVVKAMEATSGDA